MQKRYFPDFSWGIDATGLIVVRSTMEDTGNRILDVPIVNDNWRWLAAGFDKNREVIELVLDNLQLPNIRARGKQIMTHQRAGNKRSVMGRQEKIRTRPAPTAMRGNVLPHRQSPSRAVPMSSIR